MDNVKSGNSTVGSLAGSGLDVKEGEGCMEDIFTGFLRA
jgi:hypothetical protein